MSAGSAPRPRFFRLIFSVLSLLSGHITGARSWDLQLLQEDIATRDAQLLKKIRVDQSFEMFTTDFIRYAQDHNRESVFPLRVDSLNGIVYSCDYCDSEASDKAEEEAEKETEEQRPWISRLDGVCGVFTKGWWTFQWCHRDEIIQYHLHATGVREPIWSLGKYVDPESSTDVESAGVAAADLDEGETLRDFFDGGQRCDETDGPRHTTVRYRCCNSADHGRAMREGGVQNAKAASAHVLSVEERQVCEYEITICAVALCEHQTRAQRYRNDRRGSAAKNSTATAYDILSNSFHIPCLQRNEGWWTYEICFSNENLHRRIRQFHLSAKEMENGRLVPSIEASYSLGQFNEANLQLGEVDKPATKGEGNIAPVYTGHNEDGEMAFQLEFDGGTPCDVSSLERSTTVEFVCGDRNELESVVEDRTCHYRMRVANTELCRHPRFQKVGQHEQAVCCTVAQSDDERYRR
mmetsp:Transcript_3828/g.14916  ORF Transcript_3828/g.14916 Transcript_3828/m.14916 type:complete len:465 (-) Transcript_3828:1564-2958(-)